MITPADESIPDSLTDSVYFAVWSSFYVIGRSTRKDVANRIFNEHASQLEAEVPPEQVKKVYCTITDETAMTDEEILEIAEKRFAKCLPMDRINLVLLMEMN